MAAEVLRLPATTPARIPRPVEEVLVPVRRHGTTVALPFPAPLLHPRAVEALLLAFRPIDERE